MPMLTLHPVAEDKTNAASGTDRRPTLVPLAEPPGTLAPSKGLRDNPVAT